MWLYISLCYMSRYYIQRSLLSPSLCSSLKPFSVHLSLPSSYPQLLLTPIFLAPTLSSHLPPLTLSSSPCLPFFLPSFLCSFHSLFAPSRSTSTPPIFLSDHITISAVIWNRLQMNLNSVDENVPTSAWLCVNVDLSFVESLIILILKTHDGST